MQTQITFKSRKLDEPTTLISLRSAQTILTFLALATAVLALIELALT